MLAGDRAAARGDLTSAIASYTRAVALQPTMSQAYERLCHATSLHGRHDEALHCCQTALALHPSSSFLHLLSAEEHAALGAFAKAALSYARADALTAPDADTRLNWGITLTAAGRGSEAIERLRSAVSLAPTYATAYTELARALESRALDSVEARHAAVRLSPATAGLRVEHGNALQAGRRPTEAAAAMRRALQLAPVEASLAAYFGLGG